MFCFLPCLNQNPAQGSNIGARTKADTIEAIIGAVYQDGGYDAAKRPAQTMRSPGPPALGRRGSQTETPRGPCVWCLLPLQQIQRRTSKQTGVSLGVAFFSQDLLTRERAPGFWGIPWWDPWRPDAGGPGLLVARGLITERAGTPGRSLV
ncbi:hypothetical protein CORC01_09921 [Colletotrichum orchidophilum]|uniref:RNase III domain-containing protein n=1 Tax=Colletotrichum orchidophilum TaxID=1209926 RepID=A0A1G4B099_9PEZI|nr:uncharacterized protein CORC01_09921 [Colletotrichum orchidophilum]OHE94814.1 hypothetical protein CORC01_09921 [Colletotrichum orchidophilum]